MDHMETSSSAINSERNEALKKNISAEVKKIFGSSEDGAAKSTDVDMISNEQSNSNNSSDDESAISIDVKVCDICGDAGREDMLAVCSKCGDGAEHTYCMRIKMDKVPNSSWMCEECALLEEKDKMKSVKPVQPVSYEMQKSPKGLGQKKPTRIKTEGLGINLSRGENASPSPSSDVISSNRIATQMRKRTEQETKLGSSSKLKDHKASYPQDGKLSKAKSFNDSEKRPKVLRLNEVPQSQLPNETRGRKKLSGQSSLRKTVSFNDASTGRPTASSPTFQSTSSKPFGDGDLKSLLKLARSAREADESRKSQSLASSNASEEAMNKGGSYNAISALKSPLSSSNAIQEDKPASQVGSSSSQTDNMQDSEETHHVHSSDYTSYRQLATFAFPDLDCIWRGQFEIQQNDRFPRVIYGIQAHVSIQASPRVPEVVRKFSSKISLQEVSRVNAWPYQFQESSPQDDSIALYFFAEDNASFVNYRSLLHSMADQDLTLRGTVSGIELLIFSSSLLPEGSRYWNGLLYMWGVFRCRKVAESQIAG